jgi:hypothetical protein
MRIRNQRGTHGDLDGFTIRVFPFSFDQLNDAEQFDGVAEFVGELDVDGGDVPDAFDVNAFRPDPEAVRERSQNPYFMHRVDAIDVE